MNRGMKQVAVAATLKLLGLAKIEEATSDYLAFRLLSIRHADRALQIAEELEQAYGYVIAIRG